MTGRRGRHGATPGARRLCAALLAAALALAAGGCQTIKDAGSEIFSGGNSLEAVMIASNGSAATGTVVIGPTRSGIALRVGVSGLPLRQYRVAIHTDGNCSSRNAFSAGPPWVPEGAPPDFLANLAIGWPIADGTLVMVTRINGVTIEAGPNSISGRSIIIHDGGGNLHRESRH